MNRKRLSIITVVFNDKNGLSATIKSLRNQTIDQNLYEYIVIDGGSTDGTIAVAKEFALSIDFFVSEGDGGIYDAMNKGASAATGDWFYFLNAGDILFAENTLDSLYKILSNTDQSTKFLYGDFIEVFQRNQIKRTPPNSIVMSDMLFNLPICHQASLIRREVFEQLNGFNLAYRLCADHELILRLIDTPDAFKKINLIFCRYDTNGISAHRRLEVLAERKGILIQRNLFTLKMFLLYCSKVVKGTIVVLMSKIKVLTFYRKLKFSLGCWLK